MFDDLVPHTLKLAGFVDTGVAIAEVVECHGEVGQEGGVVGGEPAVELDGFFGGGQGVGGAAGLAVAGAGGVEGRWGGRGGLGGASRRSSWTASSAGARASGWRPTSL